MPRGAPSRSALMNRLRRHLVQAWTNHEFHRSHFLALYVRHIKAAGFDLPASVKAVHVGDAILGVLSNQPNGTVYSPQGHAVDFIRNQLEYRLTAATASPYMINLERDGLLTRVMHVGGRKTDRVTLTPAGWAYLGGSPVGPCPEFWLPGFGPTVPAPAPAATVPIPPATPASSSTDDLVRLCLRLGEERDEWHRRYDQAVANGDELVQRLIVADAEITRLRGLVPEAVTVHSNGSGTSTVGSRISDSEREALDRLMREIPTV